MIMAVAMRHDRFWQVAGFALFFMGWAASLLAGLDVTRSGANVRVSPSLDSAIVDVARRGERVEPEAEDQDFVRVTTPRGIRGWVYVPVQHWSEAQIRAALASHRHDASAGPPAGRIGSDPGAATYTLTLADLGLRQGHYFEGAHTTHAATWYFPLPLDGVARSGVFRLRYHASELVDAPSVLRVDINGRPARVRQLAQQQPTGWLEVPLNARDLDKPVVKITVRASILASHDRCFDERRLALLFVQLLPESRLDVQLAGRGDSLAAVWSTLPPQPRLYLPGPVSKAAYATFLDTLALLHRMHRKIAVAAEPGQADILIGRKDQLTADHPEARPVSSDQTGWVAVAKGVDGRRQVLIADDARPLLLSRHGDPWLHLLKAPAYRTLDAPATHPPDPADNTLDLIRAGLGTTQYVSRTAEWALLLNEPLVSAGKRLQGLKLNLVSAPETDRGSHMLHVYLNGVLQESARLHGDGKPQTLRFALNQYVQRAGANHLSLVVQRTDPEGDCRGDIATYPVQLLPGSILELADANTEPRQFNDLRALFSRPPEIWLEISQPQDLARQAELLRALFGNHDFPIDRTRLHLFDGRQTFAPQGPFILIGHAGRALDKSGLHVDRGRVEVVDSRNKVLLGIDRLPGITVAQIARHQGHPGLWILPAMEGPLPPAEEFFLDQGDVAFADGKGILLTLNTQMGAVSRIEYPDYTDWFDIAGRYRFWLIALGWTLLAAVMAVLYRKSKKHAGSV